MEINHLSTRAAGRMIPHFFLQMANCWAILAMSNLMGIKLTIMRILHRILCDIMWCSESPGIYYHRWVKLQQFFHGISSMMIHFSHGIQSMVINGRSSIEYSILINGHCPWPFRRVASWLPSQAGTKLPAAPRCFPWGFPVQMENNGKPIGESKIAIDDLPMNHGAFRQQALELLADLFLWVSCLTLWSCNSFLYKITIWKNGNLSKHDLNTGHFPQLS